MFAIATAPFVALGPQQDRRAPTRQLGQRSALRLLPGAVSSSGGGGERAVPGVAAQTVAVPSADHRLRCWPPSVFLIATLRAADLPQWHHATGYTYGALATPIAFLLFAFFLGFAIMIGAELNAAIEEELPAPDTHAEQFRRWLEEKGRTSNGGLGDAAARSRRSPRRRKATALLLEVARRSACSPGRPASRAWRPCHREHLAAQCDDVCTHDGALGDLVLLDVVEVLRGVAVGPVVDAFVGVGALDRLGSHESILPGKCRPVQRATPSVEQWRS